ncbi:hypothetical protein Tco_0422572 [Tanacetum coccineum]
MTTLLSKLSSRSWALAFLSLSEHSINLSQGVHIRLRVKYPALAMPGYLPTHPGIVEVHNDEVLAYKNPSFEYYSKELKTDLDNGLKKLCNDQYVSQMLKYVDRYKVIDLYVDHSIIKDTLNVDESLLVNELDNDLFIGNQMLGDIDEDVIEDVCEDEWLQNSLRLIGRRKKDVVKNDNVVESSMNHKVVTNELRQSYRNESINVKSAMDHGSGSQNGSDMDLGSGSQNGYDKDHGSSSDAGFDNNDDSDSQVGSKEIVEVVEEGFEDEEVNHDDLDSKSDSEYEDERKKL